MLRTMCAIASGIDSVYAAHRDDVLARAWTGPASDESWDVPSCDRADMMMIRTGTVGAIIVAMSMKRNRTART